MQLTTRVILSLLPALAFAQEILPPGQRPDPPETHALIGGKVVVRPGQVLEGATILVRAGLIVAVGPDVVVPPEAHVWDMAGKTIYAGFIEPYLAGPTVVEEESEDEMGAGLAPFFGVKGDEKDRGAAGPSYANPRLTPERRAALSYQPDRKRLEKLWKAGFTAANVAPDQGIVRGTSVLVLLSDVDPNRAILRSDVFQCVCLDPRNGRVGRRHDDDPGYPDSVMGAIAAVRQLWFDAAHHARVKADYEADPRGKKRPEFDPALDSLSRRLPVLFEATFCLGVDQAAHVAREHEMEAVYLASGQEWRRPDLARAARGPFLVPVAFPEAVKLPEDDDWGQVSLDQLRAWDWAPENPAVLRREGIEIALTTHRLADRSEFQRKLLLAIERGLSEEEALAALTTVPAKLLGVADRLGAIEPGRIANLTVTGAKGYFAEDARVEEVWIEGRRFVPEPGKGPEPKKEEETDEEKAKKAEERTIRATRVAKSPLEGRGPIETPPAVLVRGATVWTCGAAGVLEDADVLAVGGIIRAVGKGLEAPDGARIVEANGKHVTPGLIDCHSHSFIVGGVNEATVPSSAMVRIGDVINSETDHIYQQLAGGLTCANQLHGSANPIGGQSCIVKLRDGETPDGLKLADAPQGIKFALGENVKQSNWGEKYTTRFPQTRMGVRTFIANRLAAAERYLAEWERYSQNSGPMPRRDLELEALGEILRGRRLIHCHSYRQDEILMLIRLMDSLGVRIGTFQHVLEGYKVADEIAAHGAGASCFTDWWAYKFEVYDAIPYAGSLMAARGVTTSFNSDSSELARRMHLEAAKAVKYGGTPEEEALKFVTINPARQLGIEHRVGSIEVGKDADFVIWSHSPLSTRTVCEQTWIEGKKYFDITLAAARAESLVREREALVEKAKKLAKEGKDGKGKEEKGGFFEQAREHEYDYGWEVHCGGAHRVGEGH